MGQKKNIKLTLTIFVIIVVALVLPRMGITGSLEPLDPPGPTMKTLDQIPPTWSQKLQCDTTACPRFEIVMDGAAVLDKETGLVWEKSAWRTTPQWSTAISMCSGLELGGRKGWRLPTVAELASLVDPTQDFPALPSGHPFVNVYDAGSWSATNDVSDTSRVYCVYTGNGDVGVCYKTGPFNFGVWCVRGGQGVGSQ
jgi:hypothetical protein